jgi:IclR family acetate operon transcriptional repressor
VERTLSFLELIISDRGIHSVTHLSGIAGIPVATAHRQVRTLATNGFLTPVAKGRHVAGPRLISMGQAVDPLTLLCDAARPVLAGLARRAKGTAHFGILYQDMVTYLVKASGGHGDLFTAEGKQLEAYCSGIGKALLASLSDVERDQYLNDGPFTALTERTITDPLLLRRELVMTQNRGFAIDDGEVADGVCCVAVPVKWPDGTARAAISLTRMQRHFDLAAAGCLAQEMTALSESLVTRILGRRQSG